MKTNVFFGVVLILSMLCTAAVSADGLSVQLKRTNPGIANAKPAEIIFDVVNTDMDHKIEGFIWCRSPDDVFISSSMGAASGSGAQYVSQMFFINEGPSQKALSLVLESNSPGDKNAGCIIKYIPYLEKESTDTSNVDEIKTVTSAGTTVDDKKLEFTQLEQGNTTQKVLLVDGSKMELADSNSTQTFEDLTIKVLNIYDNSVEIEANYVKETSTSTKTYLRQNGQYVNDVQDNDYRELRLDKSIPFVEAPANSDVQCKDNKTSCTANDVAVTPGTNLLWWIIGGIGIVLALTIYILGRGSK